ncbi:Uncharacterised protein [uncultured archaeon]|nr:Uncharacterised protein [uncultured archaeon]
MLRRNEDAVSPAMGSMLLATMAVMLMGVSAMFLFSLPDGNAIAPNAIITAANNPDTSNVVDLKIQHKSGDVLKAGYWKISIVPVGQPPVFVTSDTTMGEFSVGNQIITSNITSNGSYPASSTGVIVTNRGVYYGSPHNGNDMAPGQKYDIKLVHSQSNAVLLDTVVEVR